MKKKIFALLLVMIMLMALMPQTALAATLTLDSSVSYFIDTDGVTLYLDRGSLWIYYYNCEDSSYYGTYNVADGDTIKIADNAKVRLVGEKDVNIECGSNVTLVLESVTSDLTDEGSNAAIEFTGTGNTLILSGTSSLKGGNRNPGIRVLPGAELEIKAEADLM